QLLVDGTESTTATVAGGYLSQLAGAWSQGLRLQTIDRRGWPNRLPRVESQPRVFYNPDLRSMWHMAPALLALVLTVLMQNLTALSIARERELGTLEQLVMTPIRPAELLLGKLLPYGLVGLADAAVVTGIVVGVLGVPLRGSLLVLSASTVVFLFATLGLGLVISTVSANQQQAQLTNFFLTFPSLLLSGFIFPIDNLPVALKPFSYAVPMRYFLEVVRGVFLRGSGFDVLWPQLLGLLGLGVLFFTIGARRFHKRLD
ncbi:MAG: ABC transporter permease, partial [Armatimonadetes bacterium]|nr:ABC transporter permease [Armatimonadota bacterium]